MDRRRILKKVKEEHRRRGKEQGRKRKHASPSTPRRSRPDKKRRTEQKGKGVVHDSDSSSETDNRRDSCSYSPVRKHRRSENRQNGGSSRKQNKDKNALYELLYQLLDDSEDGSEDESQPINKFRDLEVQPRTTYYRSNLKAAAKDLQGISFRKAHLEAIHRTPFWLLFNSIYTTDLDVIARRCHKHEEDIRCVMKSYHMQSESFLIAGELRKITKKDVQLILGVTGGSIPVPLMNKDYDIPPWVRRCFDWKKNQKDTAAPHPQLYKAYILETLKTAVEIDTDDSYEDVARLVHCYLLGAFLAPTKNGSANWHITCFCEIFEDIYKYDWCDYILNMLMDQIKKSENWRAGGCTMLLLYWLCEHTTLIKPVEEICVPRYLRWDLSQLRDKLQDRDLRGLKSKYVLNSELKRNSSEKVAYRTLKQLLDSEYNIRQSTVEMDIRDYNADVAATVELGCGDREGRKESPPSSRSQRWKARTENLKKATSENHGDALDCSKERTRVIQPEFRQPVLEKQKGDDDTDGDNEVIFNTPDRLNVNQTNEFINGGNVEKEVNRKTETETVDVVKESDAEAQQIGVRKKPLPVFNEGSNSGAGDGMVAARTPIDMGNQVHEDMTGAEKIGFDDKACDDIIRSSINVRGWTKEGPCFSPRFIQYAQNHHGDDLASLDSIVKSINKDGGIESSKNQEKDDTLDQPAVENQQQTKIQDVTKRLEEIEKELKEVQAKLQASTNKMEAMEHVMPKLIKQNVEAALKVEIERRNAAFEEHFRKQIEENEKLRFKNHELQCKLNPSGSQFVAKEVNIVLMDTMADFTDTIRLMEDLNQSPRIDENSNKAEIGEKPKEREEIVNMEKDIEQGGDFLQPENGIEINGDKNQTTDVAVTKKCVCTEGKVDFCCGKGGKEEQGSDCLNAAEMDMENKPTKIRRAQSKRIYKRTSMVDKVKEMTENDDCKPVDVDVIDLDYFKSQRPDTRGQFFPPLSDKYPAVQALSEIACENMQEFWDHGQESAIVWKGIKDCFLDVLMSDILLILHDGRISNSVVDAWGSLLLRKYASFPGASHTTIFLSPSWDWINNYGGSNKSTILYGNVDKRLEEVSSDYILLFPMLTKGKSRGKHENENHWTLLKLDLVSCQWSLYNSIQPHSKKTEDVHLTRSLKLVEYIENKLRMMFKMKYPNHMLLNRDTVKPVLAACPQQVRGSVDCGVVLCDNMEQIVARRSISKYKYKREEARSYRTKMVEWFMGV